MPDALRECQRVLKPRGILALGTRGGRGRTSADGRLTVLWKLEDLTDRVG